MAIGALLFSVAVFSCGNPFWPEDSRDHYTDGSDMDLRVGKNGNWWINGSDTGIPSNGQQSPVDVRIGDNGNWFIDGQDTGVPATGPQGPQGESGSQGEQGEQGPAPELVTGIRVFRDEYPYYADEPFDLPLGESVTLVATVYPDDAVIQTVLWETADGNIRLSRPAVARSAMTTGNSIVVTAL